MGGASASCFCIAGSRSSFEEKRWMDGGGLIQSRDGIYHHLLADEFSPLKPQGRTVNHSFIPTFGFFLAYPPFGSSELTRCITSFCCVWRASSAQPWNMSVYIDITFVALVTCLDFFRTKFVLNIHFWKWKFDITFQVERFVSTYYFKNHYTKDVIDLDRKSPFKINLIFKKYYVEYKSYSIKVKTKLSSLIFRIGYPGSYQTDNCEI